MDKPARAQPLNVLLIENDAADAELCLSELRKAGFEVSANVVETPREVNERLSSKSYDIVLADYTLPGWSGMEALEYVKQEEKDIPFILVTGSAGEEIAVECMKNGAADYILKDRLARLPSSVRRALEEQKLRQERSRAQLALRASEERYRLLFERNLAGVYSTTLDGRILVLNEACAQMFGYASREAAMTHSLRDISPDATEMQMLIALVQKEKVFTNLEVRLRRIDGHPIWVLASASLLEREKGEPPVIVGTLIDITGRKQAVEALRQSEERFRLLIEGVKDYGIFMLDPDGRVISWNSGAKQIEGYGAEEIIGQPCSRFYTAEDVERGNPEKALKVAASEGRSEGESWQVRKDGSRYWANVIITAVQDEAGRLRGFSNVTRDFTERKRAEEGIRKLNEELERRVIARTAELEAANKELETFTSSVSHDLRAPLRQIAGFSKILLGECSARLDPGAQHYLERIQEGTRRMGQMVDDLLDLARVGRQEPARQLTGLNSLVQEVLKDLEPEYGGREIDWRIGKLPFVECDPALMKQVFANLLSNAVKFTRLRERAVIQVDHMKANNQTLVFVRDNGVGFNMKYADKLFGVFQRLHCAEDFEGTGVGLATVQHIIRKHGGRVWAEAELDKGATFFFSLGAAENSRQ